ncbi:MAG: transcription termination factor Rho [Eubacterium sp.]|nr:transcription termination factor Rho [Eubacterium sp.]
MDYKKLKVAELRALAQEKGIRGTNDMKKADLVDLLEKIDLMRSQKEAEAASKKEEKAKPAKKVKKTEPAKKTEKAEPVKKSSAAKNLKKAKPMPAEKDKAEKENTAEEKPAENVAEKMPENDIKDEYAEVEMAESFPEDIEEEAEETAQEEKEFAEGILEVMADGFGFIRSDNYMPGDKDIYVAPSQIRKFRLRTGDIVRGPIRRKNSPNEKFSALLYIESVNGYTPAEIMKRHKFEDMTPIFPNERIHLDYTGAPVSLRIVDLFSPIGKGQRGMIVSPPKAGKTTLLKQIAKRISVSNPEMNLIVLLIDERPEEVTDIKEYIEGKNAEVIYSTFDELPEHHKRVSEMVIERAKRLVESGQDVVILVDSITRLARAYNLTVSPSGRTLSGGLDPAALHMPKKFFGAARNMREGGSLTILATALIDTGSRMDDVVFEEFKGTGNMELVLDRDLQEKRVFPAIDISKSGTRKDDLLLSKEETEVLDIIHSRFHSMKNEDVTEDLLKLMSQTKNNEVFLGVARKLFAKNR